MGVAVDDEDVAVACIVDGHAHTQPPGRVALSVDQLGAIAVASDCRDEPGFVRQFFGFPKSHPRVRVAVYYQSAR